MAAFPAANPLINEVVGSFGNFVTGVAVCASGTVDVDLSSKMTRIDGVVGTSSSAATAVYITYVAATRVITINCGAGTDVISYIAFGLTKR